MHPGLFTVEFVTGKTVLDSRYYYSNYCKCLRNKYQPICVAYEPKV